MLDDYKDKQSVAYNILVNEIKNNHISHAYLIDENNNSESFNFVMAFVKSILCDRKNTSYTNCNECLLCKRIDDGNYPEIKIIEPDGMLIKKKQILDLQQEFSRSTVEGKKRIYIIRDADKMRSETANSMLKFLEEPDNDIIAILLTNNYSSILSTIISRCQIIKLNNDTVSVENKEEDGIVLNFITSMETKGIRTILNTKELLFNYVSVKDREKMIVIFDKMIDMYYDIMKINVGNLNIKYLDYIDELSEFARLNSCSQLTRKINYLVQAKDSIKFNVNCNLLIDSLIVNIGGNYEGSWN